jgi:hypothetical protein
MQPKHANETFKRNITCKRNIHTKHSHETKETYNTQNRSPLTFSLQPQFTDDVPGEREIKSGGALEYRFRCVSVRETSFDLFVWFLFFFFYLARYSSTYFDSLKMFLYTSVAPNNQQSESSLTTPSTNPNNSNVAHCASADVERTQVNKKQQG